MSNTQYFSSHPKLPFSEAVREHPDLVKQYLFSVVPQGDNFYAALNSAVFSETRQTMENIKETLAKHGLTMNNVIKCLVMMADMSEWKAMNEVYVTYFPEHLPARSAFGATALAMGARLEIECIAAF
jgi:enamine deaminase RidA (YjgF/YER057c/UK114 family)